MKECAYVYRTRRDELSVLPHSRGPPVVSHSRSAQRPATFFNLLADAVLRDQARRGRTRRGLWGAFRMCVRIEDNS